MSAANFYTINAAAVFAVTDKGASCGRLLTTGRRRGWSSIHDWDGARSYPGLALLEKRKGEGEENGRRGLTAPAPAK